MKFRIITKKISSQFTDTLRTKSILQPLIFTETTRQRKRFFLRSRPNSRLIMKFSKNVLDYRNCPKLIRRWNLIFSKIFNKNKSRKKQDFRIFRSSMQISIQTFQSQILFNLIWWNQNIFSRKCFRNFRENWR